MTLKWREQLELWDSMRIACWVREDGFSVHRLTSFGGLVRYRVYAPEGVPVADWPVFRQPSLADLGSVLRGARHDLPDRGRAIATASAGSGELGALMVTPEQVKCLRSLNLRDNVVRTALAGFLSQEFGTFEVVVHRALTRFVEGIESRRLEKAVAIHNAEQFRGVKSE